MKVREPFGVSGWNVGAPGPLGIPRSPTRATAYDLLREAINLNTMHPLVFARSSAAISPYTWSSVASNIERKRTVTIAGVSFVEHYLEQRCTNLLLWTADYSNAVWTKTGVTRAAAAGTTMTGVSELERVTEDSSTGVHEITQTITKAASALRYAAAVDIKAGNSGTRNILLKVDDGAGNGGYAIFSQAGAIVTDATGIGTAFTLLRAVVQDNNGIKRAVLQFTTNTATSLIFRVGLVSGTTQSYTGDGASNVVIGWNQVEAGDFASFYSHNTSSQNFRAGDDLYSQVPDLPQEATFMFRVVPRWSYEQLHGFTIFRDRANSRITLAKQGTGINGVGGGQMQFARTNAAGSQADQLLYPQFITGQACVVGGVCDQTSVNGAVNGYFGCSPDTAIGGAFSAVTQPSMGNTGTTGSVNGQIIGLMWPRRLTPYEYKAASDALCDVSHTVSAVAFGDSLTAGAGGSVPWTAYAQTLIPAPSFIGNEGVGAQGTSLNGQMGLSPYFKTYPQILERLYLQPQAHSGKVIIYMGMNNVGIEPMVVRADIQTAVNKIREAGGDFIVVGVHNARDTTEDSGSANWTIKTAHNTWVTSTFGSRGVDYRPYLIAAGNPVADAADIAADRPPNSLMTDTIHPNSAGNLIIAQRIYAAMQAIGWCA